MKTGETYRKSLLGYKSVNNQQGVAQFSQSAAFGMRKSEVQILSP